MGGAAMILLVVTAMGGIAGFGWAGGAVCVITRLPWLLPVYNNEQI